MAKYHRLGDLSNRSLFSHSLEGEAGDQGASMLGGW